MFIIIILILVAFLVFAPLPIIISFGYIHNKKYLKINGKNIILENLIKKAVTTENKKNYAKVNLNKAKMELKDYLVLHKRIKRIVHIHRLEFNILAGSEDPFISSNIYNFLTLSEVFTYLLFNYLLPIKHYKIRIFPHMNKNIFEFKGKCIFFISIANTIRIIYIYRSLLKEIRNNRSEDNVKSSNRQFT